MKKHRNHLAARESMEDRLDRLQPCLSEEASAVTRTLIDVLHIKDEYTARHGNRVGHYSFQIASGLGITSTELENITTAAILHDIGKIGMSDRLLLKRGSLTGQEWTQIKRHCELGWSILRDIEGMEETSLMLLHHHERFDGAGYPVGLAGKQIPLGARIISIADAFDAMTTNRPYRAAIGLDAAMNELRLCAGTQFDPEVVEAFLTILPNLCR